MNHSRNLKGLSFFLLISLLCTGIAFSAGYKIPEQSADAVALSAAQVANAHGPAASYNNPANMVWEPDQAAVETSLNVIMLPGIRFRGTVRGETADADSKSEMILLPNLHYISPKIGKFRLGLSLVYPFGASKRWDQAPQETFFQEFTLKTIELNGSIGYRIGERLSVGGGVRGIYTEGIVKGVGSATLPGLGTEQYTRDLKGDDFSYGYYLALAAKPGKNLMMAVTYRSEVTPKLKGNAKISASGANGGSYDDLVEVDVVLPATLQVAAALSHKKILFEAVFERTYWSRYKTLDFNYSVPLEGALNPVFDRPIEKNWQDANTYRFGLTYEHNKALSWMFGFAIDETPIPEESLDFEIPDADALIYSTGFAYRPCDRTRVALAYLLSKKEDRQIVDNKNGINGKFESSVHLVNLSFVYAF